MKTHEHFFDYFMESFVSLLLGTFEKKFPVKREKGTFLA
jgi:hypothetical protein